MKVLIIYFASFSIALLLEALVVYWYRYIGISKIKASLLSSSISLASSFSVLLIVDSMLGAAIMLALGHGIGSYLLGGFESETNKKQIQEEVDIWLKTVFGKKTN